MLTEEFISSGSGRRVRLTGFESGFGLARLIDRLSVINMVDAGTRLETEPPLLPVTSGGV